MEAQVIFHEGGDGEVAVIVPRLNAQRQRPVALARQLGQPRRLQLIGQELVVIALVDQDRHFFRAAGQQMAAVVLQPLALVAAQIGGERLAAPRHLARVDDRRERRYRAEALRIAKCHHQRAVAAHRVAEDRLTIADAEVLFDQRRQFGADVVVHAEVAIPRRLGGVQVEPGALAQIVTFVVRHLVTARAGVRHHQHQAQLGGDALRAGFQREVLVVAGQPRQPVQHRRRVVIARRRQVDAECHVAIQALRRVAITLLPAAEHAVLFEKFQ